MMMHKNIFKSDIFFTSSEGPVFGSFLENKGKELIYETLSTSERTSSGGERTGALSFRLWQSTADVVIGGVIVFEIPAEDSANPHTLRTSAALRKVDRPCCFTLTVPM